MKYLYILLALVGVMTSCGVSHPSEPSGAVKVDTLPALYPDYTDVTVPANIAPLRFMVADRSVDECVARLEGPFGTLTYGDGRKVLIDEQEWQEVLHSARGNQFSVTLYTRSEGQWRQHPAFSIHVATDSIDPWLSYRLIEPSYVAYEDIDLVQRNVTSFQESVFASNHIGQRCDQCLNCHSYQNYHTENMLYHVRGAGGGTMLIRQGHARLMTAMRREGMISNPVYPAWHPTLPLIAFSTNHTGQFFHTQSVAKVEVQDTESALVLYDVERDSMYVLPHDPERYDNFPTWSPDGRRLYYTSAQYVPFDTTTRLDRDIANHYQEMQYNLMCCDFCPDSMTFGQPQLLLDLVAQGQSASLPRVSPDGRSLLYASGMFGCFHIWHPDADIRRLDLTTMQIDSLQALNSARAESYPTWSSNGRWIIFATRRDDSNYSRVCISYFDAEGRAHKAFALPQADPEHDCLMLRSYNRPEPMVEQVSIIKN